MVDACTSVLVHFVLVLFEKGPVRGLLGLRLGGETEWLCRGWGHRGGRACSAQSNVSPRYQNFLINEDTQISEGQVGVGEVNDLQTHLLAAAKTRCSRLTTCFLAVTAHNSPKSPCTTWLTVITLLFVLLHHLPAATQWIVPVSRGWVCEEYQD